MSRVYSGPWGTITELALDPVHNSQPEHAAGLAHWFLSSPPAHPLWPHYILFTCHLRDIEGQTRPPTKPRPASSHNLMLIALNPHYAPWTAENVIRQLLATSDAGVGESAYLSPLNWSEFVDNATDDQAKELTSLVARGLVDGVVPIEPDDIFGGRAAVKRSIALTIEHIQRGGHPFRGVG